jgi:hypothetical protein
MSCIRCGGLMVVEMICDLMEHESRSRIDTARCVNCGNFEDAIIRANRVSPPLPSHGQSRLGKARGPRIAQSGCLREAM